MVDANYFMKADPQEILRMQLTSMEARREILARQVADTRTIDRNMAAEQLKAAEGAIESYVTRIAELNAVEAARKRAEEQENANYWLRRFCTSLAIANGAAFAALAAGFLNTSEKAIIASALTNIMASFAVGMATAGVIPALLWARAYFKPKPESWWSSLYTFALISLVFCSLSYFGAGIVLCIQAVASFA